ncbi:uncharacterized protein LOC132738960 [Ruditapes philippinarum]|uniref:uncharacterized protein LOC132738960 n=1 Tax=Ruditapes philippinarum TaxID=129788 RepID=UPI00295BC424|nr:uncharacterized protein LOC132738960 [Ruditapes philippinarum]
MKVNMFRALRLSVKSGNKAGIEQILNDGKDDISLSMDDCRDLFKEAIMATNHEVVQLLIDTKILDNERCPLEYLKPLEGRTIFGFTVLEKFDEEIIKILSSNGYDILCNEECAELVTNIVESFHPEDRAEFNTCLDKLKIILTHSSNVSWQTTFRELLFSKSKCPELMDSVEWLNNHFKYGYGLCQFKTVDKIHMELGEERWSDAINSILTLGKDDVNTYVYDSFPPSENVPKWTLLAYAMFKRNAEIVKMLIDKGADVNKHSERLQNGRLVKFTPFELAVEKNVLECCRLLIENGANIFLQSYNSLGNILKNAICNGNVAMVKLILSNRSYSDNDIKQCIDDIEHYDHDVTTQAEMKECLIVYIRFGKSDTTKSIKAMLLFEYGTEEEAVNFVEDFTAEDLNEEILPETFKRSWTLLTYATKLNKLKIVKTLLDKGCDIHQFTREMSIVRNGISFKSPLMFAIEENNSDICELLLNRGALMGTDLSVNSVLSCALRQKKSHILHLLVQHMGDVNDVLERYCYVTATEGSIPLRDAIDLFSLELVCFMFRRARISLKVWIILVQNWLQRRESLRRGIDERGHCLIYLLVDYLAFVPHELITALAKVYKPIFPGDSINMEKQQLRKRVVRCSSLQHCCRYAVRQTVHPFTPSTVESLGLPLQLQEYLLEHPLQKYLDYPESHY